MNRKMDYGLLLSLLAVTTGLFWPVGGFDFVSLDDPLNVYDNIRVSRFSGENLAYFWQETYQHLYIPLSYNLWALVGKLAQVVYPTAGGQVDPRLFHAVNLLLHLLNVTTVYFILRQLLADGFGAACGALLFAVHPVQVEAVAWVTGLKDLLSGFLCLLSLWLYLLYRNSAARRCWPDRRAKLLYLAATFCYIFAMLAKPTVVVLPLALGVIGGLLLGRSRRQLLAELLPWTFLALPVVYITTAIQDGTILTFIPSYWQRFLVAGDAVSFYLGKLLLPLSLAVDYGRTPQEVLGQQWIYLTGLLPYAAALLLLWKFPRPWLLAGVALFLIPSLPLLGLVPFNFQDISTVADRYLYLAMLGPALLLGRLLAHHKTRPIKIMVVVALTALCFKTHLQIATWETSSRLYSHTLTINPNSWTALLNLGIMALANGQPEAARVNFEKVLAIRPDTPAAYTGLGNAYNKLGDNAAAYTYMRKAMELAGSAGGAAVN